MKKNDKAAQDEGRKTQSADAVREDFEIEESNAMRVLRGTGEENTNPHESRIEGRKISRAENFWYRHKWHAGLTLCGIAIAVVVLIQIITHVKPDLYIMYTGPAAIVGNRYDKLEAAITSVMEDTNGDGKTAISFADNTYLSADQIDAKKAATSGTFRFDYQSNNAAFQRYTTEITAGKHMFVMLDPALHDQMASAGAFVPLDEIFGGEIPASAYGDYGIRLGDTEFYKSDPDINFLPADTVLAVRIPAALDFKSDEKKAEYAEPYKELLRSIAEYVPEKSGN
mgnify:FL=1